MLDFLLNNDALSAIIAFVLVLIPAVLIHELGHFIAAKLVGITILEFGIGMPPRALKLFSYRGTDYTLNWLPLGGFVRPLGEGIVQQMGEEGLQSDRDVALARGIERPMSVSEAPRGGRIFFMAGGALANFVFAFLLFTIIALSGIPQIIGARVNVFGLDAASSLAGEGGLRSTDVVETVNGQTFQDNAEFILLLQQANGSDVTLGVRRPNVDGVLEVVVPVDVARGETETHPLVSGVVEGSPAALAGILPGDIVLTFNGANVASYEELQARTSESLDQEAALTVLRSTSDGLQIIEVTVVPRANPPEGQGAMGIQVGDAVYDTRFGLAYGEGQAQQQLVPLPLGEAMRYSIERIAQVFNSVFSLPGQLLSGTAPEGSTRLTSVLGISQMGAVFFQDSIRQNQPGIILEFIALINVALGLTNLLPIPALDGGRILFVLIEIVRGKPINPEREGMVHLVGLALLLSLMFVVLLNDIRDPITNMLR